MALIIFDIDGTLLETHRVTVPAVQRTFAAHGLAVPDEATICSYFGQPVEAYHAWLAGLCGTADPQAIIAATDKLELDLIRSEGRLYPETEAALERLRQEGHSMAVCSNAPEDYMDEFLDAHDVRRLFREVRCRGRRNVGKKDMVRELMELIPDRPAIVVGDRRDDVQAAHANGGRAVGVLYGFGGPEELADADALIRTPAELPDAIRRLL
jgi:phosphoglycolate phosphatase